MKIVSRIVGFAILILLSNSFIRQYSLRSKDISNCNTTQQHQNIKGYLMNKDWYVEELDNNIKIRFTNSEEVTYIDGKALSRRGKYYLSNTNCKNQTFDVSKVGNSTNGTYYVTKNSCYYIEIINDKKFTFYNLAKSAPLVTYFRK